jgi:hypothetical protein
MKPTEDTARLLTSMALDLTMRATVCNPVTVRISEIAEEASVDLAKSHAGRVDTTSPESTSAQIFFILYSCKL